MATDTHRPFILVSNDDGYHSPGIRLLSETLSSMADLLVCAPESARSGYSCAFSADAPLRLKRRHNLGDIEVWSCNGTPVDCVKLALDQLCQGRMPDLIVSGVNHGDNSTVNTHYSGTMGVAREGAMKNIPSVAFSSCYYDEQAPLAPLVPYILRFASAVLSQGLPKGVCLNINFPAAQEFRGVRVCRMTFGRWVNEVVKARHPRGYDYYWMVGNYANDEPEANDTDQWALSHGYVAVTPTTVDVTAYNFIKGARELLGAVDEQTVEEDKS